MVIKGKARGGPVKLADHLEKGKENERITLIGIHGLAGRDIEGALIEMDALGHGKLERTLYSASINVGYRDAMPEKNWEVSRQALLTAFGAQDQPYIEIEHEKKGRIHRHIVFPMWDVEAGRGISDSHNYRRHEEVARGLERQFGHERVQGAHVERDGVERPDRTPTQAEMQQAKRSGITPEEAKELGTQLWQTTDSGKAFSAGLEDHGWMLARGDRRGFVLIDPTGEIHSIRTRVNATAAQIRDRMADLDPANLPSVEQAQEIQRARTAEHDRAAEIDRAAQAAMQAAHAEARGKYDSLRATEREVERQQNPRRYDELRAAEPPPEVVREFESNANRTAEPAAPVYDRDSDNALWEAKLTENAINAEAQKTRQQPGDSAARETRGGGPEPSVGTQRPEPEDMRPLGKTAGEIRMAWTLSRTAEELEEALAARGISLAEVSTEEAQQSQRTAAFAKEVGNFARVLREKEIVAIDQYGAVHRFDQRTTGDLRPEIEARFDGFAGIDRAGLLNVTGTKEAMQEASREIWRAERRAEREQARPASWVEQRIAECAEASRTEGATIQQDRDGKRVGGTEALADSLRPAAERQTHEVKVHGAQAFAALLEDAGIVIARVTEPDSRVLDSWREELTKDRMLSAASGETYQGNRLDEVLTGDFAAVTRNGDVYRINPEKLGDAQRHIGDELPGVIETQAKFKAERAAAADIWAELKAANAEDRAASTAAFEGDRALHRHAAAAERGVETSLDTAGSAVDAGLHAGEGVLRRAFKIFEGIIGFLADAFSPPPPPTKDQAERMVWAAEEKQEVRAEQAARADREAQHWLIIEAQQKADRERETAAENDQHARRREQDRGYEREI
jgi:hypothetical protein